MEAQGIGLPVLEVGLAEVSASQASLLRSWPWLGPGTVAGCWPSTGCWKRTKENTAQKQKANEAARAGLLLRVKSLPVWRSGSCLLSRAPPMSFDALHMQPELLGQGGPRISLLSGDNGDLAWAGNQQARVY